MTSRRSFLAKAANDAVESAWRVIALAKSECVMPALHCPDCGSAVERVGQDFAYCDDCDAYHNIAGCKCVKC